MENIEIYAPLIFILGSIMVGAILKLFLKRINVPYTVGLFALGIILGTLNHQGIFTAGGVMDATLATAKSINPDLILNLFLPILIFSAAYGLDTHVFKKTLFNATLLSVPGLVVSMALTAVLMMGVSSFAPAYSGWTWTFALMFGALISATDPVAVVALLKDLGVSKRFSTLIDGESMLNDGTGIVLFMLFFAPFTEEVSSSALGPVAGFFVVVFGGLLTGYLAAKCYLLFVRSRAVRGEALLQTSVMILLAYLTFILAHDIFDLSGVIALVTFGLVIAYYSSAHLSERTNAFMREFWELLSYIANTLIFIIIGIIISEMVSFTWRDVVVLLIVYVGLNLVRMAMVSLFYPIMKRSGYGLSRRESLILCWGGLRGALGLTLALMVSYTLNIPEEIRRQVLFLTSGVVTLTLIINATTIKWMLEKLGMSAESKSKQALNAEIREQLKLRSESFVEKMQRDEALKGADFAQVSEWLPESVSTPEKMASQGELLHGLRLTLLNCERQVYVKLYNQSVISFESQRKLSDLIDYLADRDGKESLDVRFDITSMMGQRRKLPLFNGNKYVRNAWALYNRRSLIVAYDAASGMILAGEQMNITLDNISEAKVIESLSVIATLREEIAKVTAEAERYIEQLKESYPVTYSIALTQKSKRLLRRFELSEIAQAHENGVLSDELRDQLMEETNLRCSDKI
ncbi:MAG: sodium:proton antiporter [Rikenellaceae bacterium]